MSGFRFKSFFQGPDQATDAPAALNASALLGNSFLTELLAKQSRNGSQGAVEGLKKPLGALTGGVLPTKPVLATGSEGTHLGAAPKVGDGATERVVVDPTTGTSLQWSDRDAAGGTSKQLDFGESSVGGKAGFDRVEDGVTQSGQVGMAFDHGKGTTTVNGSIGRKTALAPASVDPGPLGNHSEQRALAAGDPRGDYAAKGNVVLGRDGSLNGASGSYVAGSGAGARGGSAGFDREKETLSVGGTYGKYQVGATLSDHSVGVQLGNGKIGGGAMADWEGDRVAFGANVALSNRFGVNAAVSMGADDWFVGAGATYMGFGGGLGYGETNGKLTRSTGDGRASSTVEDGHVATANASLVLAQGQGAVTKTDQHTASNALPADFESWSKEDKQIWLAGLDDRARAVRRPSDLDLESMDVGSGHDFARSETLSGTASLDLGILPGMRLNGGISGSSADRSNLGIIRSAEDRWDIREGTTSSGASDMHGEAGMFFGAIGGSVGREGSHAGGEELGYRISSEAGKQAFEQTRLRLGVLPGSESHVDFAELEQLAAVTEPSVEQQTRLRQLRKQINGQAQTEVGDQLAEGVQVQSKTRRAHEDSTRKQEGRFLFWSSSSKTRTTSDTVSVDALDDDGTVVRTELETRTRGDGDHAAEQVRALTTTDSDGPALAFDSQQRISGSDHLYNAGRTDNTDLLPGETAMSSQTERLVETRVSLSRADAAAIAAECNKEGSTHWSDLSARVEGLQKESFIGFFQPVPVADSPEAFDQLSPAQQDRWLILAQQASLGEEGNLFDAIPAIERIQDPERQRAAYENLVLDHRDGGNKELANGDIGSEYLEFADGMRTRSGGAIDLTLAAATGTTTEAQQAVKPTTDPAKVASKLGSADILFTPSAVVDTLVVAQRTGGPDLVRQAIEAQRVSPVLLHGMVSGDERQLQALLEATAGTEFGAQLVNVAAASASMGPTESGSLGDFYLQMVAKLPVSAQDATPVKGKHERRGRALQRNLRIPGTSAIMASTLAEAAREGGKDAVAQALAAGSITLDEVRARAKADRDLYSIILLGQLPS